MDVGEKLEDKGRPFKAFCRNLNDFCRYLKDFGINFEFCQNVKDLMVEKSLLLV